MTRGERWYRRLLRLYSAELRESSSDEMISTYLSMSRSVSGLAAWAMWCRIALDILITAPPDRLGAWRRRRAHSSRGRLMESLRQDLAYGFRRLRKSPVFTLVSVLTVAIGVGATTTVFSVTNGLLFRRLPGVERPGELVTAHRTNETNDWGAFSWLNFIDYRSQGAEFLDLAAQSTLPASLGGDGLDDEHVKPVFAFTVTHNYFRVLGARPMLGRFFSESEAETVGDAATVVLTHSTWVDRFASNPSVLGRTVRINRHMFTIIGVTAEGFNGHGGTIVTGLFLPITAKAAFEKNSRRMSERGASWMETVARLEPGVSLKQAQGGMTIINDRLAEEHPELMADQGIRIIKYLPIFAAAAGPIKIFMLLLFAVTAIVLMIGSINVAGMLLARATQRSKEIGVRLALGARRERLVRQLLTESMVLFLIGGVGGVALSYGAASLISGYQPPIPIPLALDVTPDLRVLFLALALTVGTGLLFGLAPALQGTRQPLTAVITEGGEVSHRSRLRSAFVVSQIAGSALLLVGAGLFSRGLQQARLIDPGLNPDGVHVVGLGLARQNYTEAEAADLYRTLVARAEAMPGVISVGLIDNLPLSMGNQSTAFAVPGHEPVGEGDGDQRTEFSVVSPGYFGTMEIPIVRGRSFTEADREGAPEVVIVNEELARRIWPEEDPVGKQLSYGGQENGLPVTVVGVAKDGSYQIIGEDPRFMIYRAQAQAQQLDLTLVARVEPAVAPMMTREMAGLMRQIASDLPLDWNAPMVEIMGLSLLPSKIAAGVATGFGGIGLLLAALGLYGILSQMVTQRTREIGVRMALGAGRERVRRLFLGHGLRLTVVGLGIGFATAFGITRFLGFFLYGISPTDPATFVGIGLLLGATALSACYIPARRATQTEPMEALRHE
jgi:predicted permease